MNINRFATLIIIVVMTVSCSDFFGLTNDVNKQSNSFWYKGNWFIYNGNVKPGIKSIIEADTNWEYDTSGRLLSYSTTSSRGETVKYNAKHLPITIEYNVVDDLSEERTITLAFEYNNTNKFCPYADVLEGGFNIAEQGLVPELSKIIHKDSNYPEYTGTITYSFSGDTLIVSYKEDYVFAHDIPPTEYVFDYNGAYPYQCKYSNHFNSYFIGPITYNENGMIDTYIDGECDKDTGVVIKKRTITFNTSITDAFVPAVSETCNYSNPSGDLIGFDRTSYTYNEHGDLSLVINERSRENPSSTEYSYVYDANDNWIRTIMKYQNGTESSWERTIQYY